METHHPILQLFLPTHLRRLLHLIVAKTWPGSVVLPWDHLMLEVSTERLTLSYRSPRALISLIMAAPEKAFPGAKALIYHCLLFICCLFGGAVAKDWD